MLHISMPFAWTFDSEKISGGRKRLVPFFFLTIPEVSMISEIPKSASFTLSFWSMRMLSGFMSLWTIWQQQCTWGDARPTVVHCLDELPEVEPGFLRIQHFVEVLLRLEVGVGPVGLR